MSLNSGSNASYVEMDSNHFTITTLAPKSSATRAQGGHDPHALLRNHRPVSKTHQRNPHNLRRKGAAVILTVPAAAAIGGVYYGKHPLNQKSGT